MIDQKQVAAIIENDIRPALQGHGGDIELVEVTAEGIVKVRLKGACAGCPGAQMTIKAGVEARLREAIPEVAGVEALDFA
ncbi:MAG: NifU family protein [Planctomycetes bacterium]|nr:NifU family protein [Planctomycetota bacterium]